MAGFRLGVVSVILVNFRGADDTLEAIRYLDLIDWPKDRLEIVVVDNASGDGSVERLRAGAPHARLVVSQYNDGFAGGCNRGVTESSGEFIALLNNDARPDPDWVRAAVARFEESPEIGLVASKVLDWDGKLVDYIGAAMTWYGMGYKPFTAELPPNVPDESADVLFGTGSAMFVRRSAFESAGGFDERYFMFFEDVDLGWRLNLLGWRVVYEPGSVAFHKHHASMSSFGEFKEVYLLERNALFTLYKNADERFLAEALPAAMALSIRRAIGRAHLDSESFDLRRPGGDAETSMPVDKSAVSAVFAIDQFVEQLPALQKARREIQRTRVTPEARVRELFGKSDAPIIHDKAYIRGYENLLDAFDVTSVPTKTRVLVITGDPIGSKLAGPAIRAWNIAAILAQSADVALVSLTGADELDAPFSLLRVNPGDNRTFDRLEKWADVIVFQGHAMAVFTALRKTNKILVVDIYDPMHLEQLEQGRELPAEQWKRQVRDSNDVLNDQMQRGDFFLAASDRQRMFWLGQLASLGRINPSTYDGDPGLDGLISIAPFGLSSIPPAHERAVLKGVHPGIGVSDKLVLWSGGLYNWFDPKTLIRAVAQLSKTRSNVRLYFQGTKHPHPGVPEMAIVAESRSLAKELGVLDTAVFFNDSWVDYADRQNYLTEADAGVSTHFSHIETTFSFRTRILDYLWADLPMVMTAGDHFAQLVEEQQLGVVVPPEDVGELANALERILFDDKLIAKSKKNIARVRTDYYWEKALAPLVEFVADPHHAGDYAPSARWHNSYGSRPRKRVKRSGLRHDVGLAISYLRTSGVRVVVSKIRGRLARKRS